MGPLSSVRRGKVTSVALLVLGLDRIHRVGFAQGSFPDVWEHVFIDVQPSFRTEPLHPGNAVYGTDEEVV